MFRLPDNLSAESFLASYWQKQALLLPGALDRVLPAISRNELGWLATCDDVESRLVFVERDAGKTRYRAQTGPFTADYLAALPKRDWTLLVHDVEKHLPDMRALFRHVPFIPDWRIDDLMVSFAAPGGGVGPHRDNYDVFLCQGIGQRNWQYTGDSVANDPDASDDLRLLQEFGGASHDLSNGDVLYLPPGVAHWGVANRACMTYSIGMRAPQASDLAPDGWSPQTPDDPFYRDPDLDIGEARPGYIARQAVARAERLHPGTDSEDLELALGRFGTRPKAHLCPDRGSESDVTRLLAHLRAGGTLELHGMALLACSDANLFVNGRTTPLREPGRDWLERLCGERRLALPGKIDDADAELLGFLIRTGAFDLPDES